MDASKEGEQTREPEIKKLGGKFHPFYPAEMQDIQHQTQHGPLTGILLDTEIAGLPKIPITIRTNKSRGQIRTAVSPFNPSVGYQISGEDFKLESRLEKLRRSGFGTLDYFAEGIAPFWFRIFSSRFDLAKQGISERIETVFYQIKPEFLPMIQRLRVQVMIPGSPPEAETDDPAFYFASSWEARPKPAHLRNGEINFHDFYPLDTGTLPSDNPDNLFMSEAPEGLRIYLPGDPEKLKQIEVKFVLASEKEIKRFGTPRKNAGNGEDIPKIFRDAFVDETKE